MNIMLTGLFVWRQVTSLGYLPLESFLSVESLLDEAVICVDPTSGDDTYPLAKAIRLKYPKVRIVEYVWPATSPDGSAIGQASQFALEQVSGGYVINIQADEIYPAQLVEHLKAELPRKFEAGFDGFRLKVLHTEHNAQLYQGGVVPTTADPNDPEWNWQRGAGYNVSVKIAKRNNKIKFAHDGWQFEGCEAWQHIAFSDRYPVLHLHDFFRDHLLGLRHNAADKWWTDKTRYGHYAVSADNLEASKPEWWDDEKWVLATSPFRKYMTDEVATILGRTSYRARWELLDKERQHG